MGTVPSANSSKEAKEESKDRIDLLNALVIEHGKLEYNELVLLVDVLFRQYLYLHGGFLSQLS